MLISDPTITNSEKIAIIQIILFIITFFGLNNTVSTQMQSSVTSLLFLS
jgi:hypothetical protein